MESRASKDNPLVELSNQLAAATARAAGAIVAVHARRRLPSTGVHLRPGLVVTADHTVRVEEGIVVSDAAGREAPATLAGRDPSTDLALLRVAEPPVAVADRGDVDLAPGQIVLAIGYGPRVSWGVLSAVGEAWHTWLGGRVDRLVRLDLTLYPGFSGGPLVDGEGRVIGIVTSGLSRHTPLALPLATVDRVVEALAARGRVARGYLGVGLQPVRLPREVRGAVPGAGETALIVVSVEPDGPAGRAGVILGDVLVSLDAVPVGDVRDLQARLGPDRVGVAVTARVVRAGRPVDLAITVGDRSTRRG